MKIDRRHLAYLTAGYSVGAFAPGILEAGRVPEVGEMVEGEDPKQLAENLVKLLKEEAKIV